MNKLIFLISIIFISNSFAAINPKIPWTFSRDLSEKPRGGTSTGIAVIYDQEIPTAWTRLQEANLSKYERDRRAIYALEGEYEVKFNFCLNVLSNVTFCFISGSRYFHVIKQTL